MYIVCLYVSFSCIGIKCCQTLIPPYLSVFNATIELINTSHVNEECKYAYLAELSWFEAAHLTDPFELEVQNMSYVPVVLERGIYDIVYSVLMSKSNYSTYDISPYIYSNHSTSEAAMKKNGILIFVNVKVSFSHSYYYYVFWVK